MPQKKFENKKKLKKYFTECQIRALGKGEEEFKPAGPAGPHTAHTHAGS